MKQNYKTLLIAILLLSVVIPAFSISRYKYFVYDESGFIYNASLELKGMHVYADYFNGIQKPPGVVWLVVPITYLFGNTFTTLMVSRLLIISIKTLTVLVVYLITLKLFNKREVALLSALFFSMSSITNLVGGVLWAEPVAAFFISLAFLAFISENKYRYFLPGFFVSLAGIFRPTAIFFAILLSVFISLCESQKLRKLFHYIAGGFLGFSPVLFYVFITGSFKGFIMSLVVYNKYYPTYSFSLAQKLLTFFLTFRYDFILLFLFAAHIVMHGAKIIAKVKGSGKYTDLFTDHGQVFMHAFMYSWVVVYLIPFALSRSFFDHYIYEILVPLCIISAVSFVEIFNRSVKGQKIENLFKYAACLFLIAHFTLTMVLPLDILDDRDEFLFNEFKKLEPKDILTGASQFLFLFDMDTDYYFGDSMEIAYEEAGMHLHFGKRELRSIPDLLEKKEYDIVYVRGLVINDSNYQRVCVPEQGGGLTALRRQIWGKVKRMVSLPASEETSGCGDYYYVNKKII